MFIISHYRYLNAMMTALRCRRFANIVKDRTQEEEVFTASSVEQRTTEDSCLRLFEKTETNLSDLDDYPTLNRSKTVSFLLKGLHGESEGTG